MCSPSRPGITRIFPTTVETLYTTQSKTRWCVRACVCVCVLASVMTGGGGVKHYHSLKSVSPPTTSKQMHQEFKDCAVPLKQPNLTTWEGTARLI